VVKSYPLKSTFLENHISAPNGCCASKFLHALENDQVLLALPHQPQPGMVVHLTFFFQRGVQNWLKFQQVHVYNFWG